MEGFDLPSAGPKLRDWQLVAIGRFPCELPQAILTPNAFHSGVQIVSTRKGFADKPKDLPTNPWLGWRDSNPRMPGPKPGALPLGHIPICVSNCKGSNPINRMEGFRVTSGDPETYAIDNQLSSEGFLANCRWQFSPRMHGPKPCALPLGHAPS
jgi:hypothetical protein